MKFSTKDIELLEDSSFLLRKNQLLKEISQWMHLQAEEQFLKVKAYEMIFPEGTHLAGWKIAQGEQLASMPWLALDYPKFMDREDLFFIRLLFWWGKGLCCSLHLQGESFRNLLPYFTNHWEEIRAIQGLFFSKSKDPWDQDSFGNQFSPIQNIPIKTFLEKKDFLKLSYRLPMKEINGKNDFVREAYSDFIKILSF